MKGGDGAGKLAPCNDIAVPDKYRHPASLGLPVYRQVPSAYFEVTLVPVDPSEKKGNSLSNSSPASLLLTRKTKPEFFSL